MAHVMIVYAEADRAEVPTVVARDAGHSCLLVAEHELVDRAFMTHPDLVVLTGRNPRPFARALRSVCPGTAVLALCDELELATQVELRKAGVDAVLFRPYSVQALHKALGTLLPAPTYAPYEVRVWS
jgi:DNA-binding response OmpR family regulator